MSLATRRKPFAVTIHIVGGTDICEARGGGGSER